MTDELVIGLRKRRDQGSKMAAARIEQDAATIARLEGEREELIHDLERIKDSETAYLNALMVAEAKLAQAVTVLRGLCDEWGKSDPGTLFRAHNAARAFLDSIGDE